MASSNTTNIILHFTKMLKMVILDINEIMKKSFSSFNEYLYETSLSIKDINGYTTISSSSIKYMDFLYNNKLRINGEQILKDQSYKKSFNIMSIPPFIINRTELSPKIGSSTVGSDIYDNLGNLYTISFDSFDDACNFTINFEITITVKDTIDSNTYLYYIINCAAYIDDYKCAQYKFFKNQSNMINSNMESFLLIRTNPKLTGNIKLVVDSLNNLFLDTFKVSTTSVLNKNEYRRQAISSDGNYPYDVYKVFNNVPAGELYSVYQDSYEAHKNYFDLNQQIENIYEYGAEFNNDRLYTENMHILAPLYLGKHLPDYFIIFKTDNIINKDYNISDIDKFKSMLADSKAVKIFDLRRSSTIGKYLYNYKNQISEFLGGTCSLLFIEQDNDMFLNDSYDGDNEIIVNLPNPNYREGRNTWKGIVFDKGILSSKTETSYFANMTLNGVNPQENFDMFLLNGYQRNKLLYPNIINFDFMFDDQDAEDMSMHNYFGLYLTENDFITFNLVINNKYKNNDVLQYFDADNKIINLSDTTIDVIEDNEYSDRIFFMTTPNDAMHIKTLEDAKHFVKLKVVNKPYKNIISLESLKVKNKEDEISFISLDFTNQIKPGEHLRFTSLYNYKKELKENIVLEIIASDDRRLISCDNYIYPYISTNQIEYGHSNSDCTVNTLVYRLSFYTNDIDNINELAPLSEQIERICSCINKFNSFIKVASANNETISIISSEQNTYCQHILSDNIDLAYDTKEDYIRYFNYNNLTTCYIVDDQTDLYREDDLPFSMSGYELVGKRYSSIIKFIQFDDYKNNYIYEIYKDLYEELKNIPYPIISTVKGYFPIVKHHVNDGYIDFKKYIKSSNLKILDTIFNTVISPWDVNCSIIISVYECVSNNNVINICSPLLSHIALMGINCVKDIDMYTNIIEYSTYGPALNASFKAGEKVMLNNSDPRLRLFTTYKLISGTFKGLPLSTNTEFMITSDSIIYANDNEAEDHHEMALSTDYVIFDVDTEILLTDTDCIDQYDPYITVKPVLNSSNYFIDPNDTENSNLSIPLVPMVNCQWKSNGVYFDNDSILNVDNIINDYNIYGNFIENTYTPAGNSNNQYIVNKINDIIDYDSTAIMTVKNLILNNSYKGFIKKYLISNFKIDTAIGHYNPNVLTLEFIYYGITFKFKLSNEKYKNEIKLNEFNNYEIYVINNYDGSLKNEMFINKEDEFILIINHTYCINDLYSNDSIKILNNNNNIENVKYSWYPALYNYELTDFAVLNGNGYLNKTAKKQITSTNTRYILELDLPIYENTYIDFDEEPIYAYFNVNSSEFESLYGYDTIIGDPAYTNQYSLVSRDINKESSTAIGLVYDSNINNLMSLYALNHTDYKQKAYDFRQHNTYMIKYQSDLTSSDMINTDNKLKILLYMNTFINGNMDIYIMSSNTKTYKEFNINDDYKPLSIDLDIPNKIKFNQGLFDPNFVDVFSFSVSDPIQDIIDLDTLYGNTLIDSIANIPNYFYNKILTTGSSCNYNHFSVSQRSLLSSCWDNNIYRLYDDDDTFKFVPGYSIGIHDKTFFGSTCLVLHNESLKLDKWDFDDVDNYGSIETNEHNVNEKATLSYKITLNLTKTFYNYVINSNFYNNWTIIEDSLNVKSYINNYINNTLIHFYNFKSNLDVELYKLYDPTGNKKLSDVLSSGSSKPLDNTQTYDINDYTTFIKDRPSNLNEYEKEQSIKTNFEEINNEIILSISIADYENYLFYPIVKILKY